MTQSTDAEQANWFELSILCSREQADLLSDTLIELGAASVQVTDANADTDSEEAIFGEPGSSDLYRGWRESRLTLLAQSPVQGQALLNQAAQEHDLELPASRYREIESQDWVRTTQAQFEPIPIGDRLIITPSWHLDKPIPESAIQIVLDPGLAFGTGSHPTTALCLQWLQANTPTDQNVIDYGCGSGILAIAAAKLGARSVMAIDIDDQAILSTQQNAEINDVTISTRTTREAAPEPAPIVLANILAGPLKVLAPLLQSLVAPGGSLVLAGLLDEQAQDIANAYPQFALMPWASDSGWTVLAGPKKG
jgi:ribosomal protein L11 methyltransferase